MTGKIIGNIARKRLKYSTLTFNYTPLKLIIEKDVLGFYLIVYNDPNAEISNEDYLFDSLEEAFLESKEKFGVAIDQWILQNG